MQRTIHCAAAVLATALYAPISHAQQASPAETRAIAKEAYIYGYPMVENYRVMYACFLDPANPSFKAPLNTIFHNPRLYAPDDRGIQAPNSDVIFSFVSLDLRTEPMVLTLPVIERHRYYSAQLVDLYTHNFAYLGTRATGNKGGVFVIEGPNWTGTVPTFGITGTIRAETDFVGAIIRTQMFDSADSEFVSKIQRGYQAQSLSAFLRQPEQPSAPQLRWKLPLTAANEHADPEFFNVLNFTLQFAPPPASEQQMLARFARIGIKPGRVINFPGMSADLLAAYKAGMADGDAEIDALRKKGGRDVFGSREHLNGDYTKRALGAQDGIYGESREEVCYLAYQIDADGQRMNGAENRYALHFANGELPPASAFWSLTMYDVPGMQLVENPIHRYAINNAPTLPGLKRDADGGLTLYLQSESPGADKESNWLPCPKGPFMPIMRMYMPQTAALNGTWKSPPVQRVK